MGDVLEQKEAQLAEVLAASNLDPATLTQLNAVSAHLLRAITAHMAVHAACLASASLPGSCAAGCRSARALVHDSACEPALLHPCPGHWWTYWEWQAASCCCSQLLHVRACKLGPWLCGQ